jgi:hypothetical protein
VRGEQGKVTTLTFEELQKLQSLAEQLLQLGEQVAIHLEGSFDPGEVVDLLHQRFAVFEQFSEFRNIDLRAVIDQAEEPFRTAAFDLQTLLGKVIEQNSHLANSIERHKSQLQQNIAQIDYSLRLTQRYYPVSEDHGRGTQIDRHG